ncbi:MAG TPA: CHASE2 domain-containing protein [Microscillaceae bacterium]|jgi:CHASE2 domain-containing sensor protein|nr:CHASE2 domain-containing protein [Microscillaceae bacterium]
MFKALFNWANLWITVLVFIFMWLVSIVPLNFDIINPIQQVFQDFDISDIYFSKIRQQQKGDDRIVLVNIGNLSRGEVAEVVNILNTANPKTIGIDAFFRKPKDPKGDSALAGALANVKNLVMVSELPGAKYNAKKQQYDSLETSNAMFMKKASSGFANIISSGDKNEFVTFRTFSPKENVLGKVEYAFGVRLAQMYDSKVAKKIIDRGNNVENINFRGDFDKFLALDWPQVLNKEFKPEMLKDKIVILGFMGTTLDMIEFKDRVYTPMNANYIGRSTPDMYGVVVHANIVSMILSDTYIYDAPLWLDLLISFVICFVVVSILGYLYERSGFFYDGLTLLVQFTFSVLLIIGIVYSFDILAVKLNFGITVLSIIVAGFFVEIYLGFLKKLFIKNKKA